VVFVQAPHERAEPTVVSGTRAASTLHGTETTTIASDGADPHSAVMVLEHRRHEHFVELMEPGEAAVTPAGQAFKRADPESAVTCAEQTVDARDEPLPASRRLPPYEPDAVEVKESGPVPEPQVAVGCLGHREYATQREPVADRPRRVRVLADRGGRFRREEGSGREQQRDRGHRQERRRPSHVHLFLGHRSGAASRTGAEPSLRAYSPGLRSADVIRWAQPAPCEPILAA
jgi:hypothetical protein